MRGLRKFVTRRTWWQVHTGFPQLAGKVERNEGTPYGGDTATDVASECAEDGRRIRVPWGAPKHVGPLVTALLAIAACTGDGTSPVSLYVLDGIILDSLAGTPIEGATVTAAGQTVTTYFHGGYTLPPIPEGEVVVQVSAPAFDPAQLKIQLAFDRSLEVRLRRRAPYLEELQSDGQHVTARWIDLQGDWSEGQVFVTGHTPTSARVCGNYAGVDVDPQERIYSFQCPGTGIMATITDQAKHVGRFECVAGGGCEELGPPEQISGRAPGLAQSGHSGAGSHAPQCSPAAPTR